ncbi:MAG: DUF151 domain-containing protein [Actinomycetota bacterium]|nr:DUF151 domain-containing protein [Actinomycetota bacterium]
MNDWKNAVTAGFEEQDPYIDVSDLGSDATHIEVGADFDHVADIYSSDTISRLASRRRCVVEDVKVALPETNGTLIIREVDEPNRRLLVPIALDQAATLSVYLKRVPRVRPLLPEVLIDILNQYSINIAMVSITSKDGGVFRSEVTTVDSSGSAKSAPARLSDAVLLTLASPLSPPLMVEESLLED